MKEIILRSPATIANVGPGFDIFALALERPADRVRVRLKEEAGIKVVVEGAGLFIPTEPERNTAGLAAMHFFRAVGWKGGADIEVRRHMPSCSGLGSSAASAAASAWGLNILTGANLPSSQVIEIASLGEAASGGTPHADNVAACSLGGFVFVRSHQPVAVERIPVPRIPVVVLIRRKAETTTRGLIPAAFSLGDVKAQMSGCAALIKALMDGDIPAFGRAVNFDKISEPVRSRSIPAYGRLKERALEAGAYGFNVSGGGSSVFAVCPEERMDAIAKALEDEAAAHGEPSLALKTFASNEGLGEDHGL